MKNAYIQHTWTWCPGQLDGAPIIGEACAGTHIQPSEHLGVQEVGWREVPALHHNVRNDAQADRARVGDLHFKAWNLVVGDVALRDTDVGGLGALKRTHLAMHRCPAIPRNMGARVTDSLRSPVLCDIGFVKETSIRAVNASLLQKQKQPKKSIRASHACHFGSECAREGACRSSYGRRARPAQTKGALCQSTAGRIL